MKRNKFTESEKYFLSFQQLTDEQKKYVEADNYKAYCKSVIEAENKKHQVAKYYEDQRKKGLKLKQMKKPSHKAQKIASLLLGVCLALSVSAGTNKTPLYNETEAKKALLISKTQDTEGERIK